MDKDTRNSIQRATQAARRALEEEFAAQLEGVFDIRPDGTVAPEAGRHLADEAEALRARVKLVAAVEHHREQGLPRAVAVATLLRESAFTTLNRFVALKMLEARGIVQECVSRGPQSAGFKEFFGLAPGLTTLPDQGYRLYLDSLFDEIGREVRVLFDRRDPASLLWPRKPALDALFGILNAADLAGVWGEDETIGWVYQYFNGEDERRQMRAESQAPRNSRELAVRNQFFTPRYVVEFLTDNTLGRTWVEMRRSETALTASCRYLVKRPNEVFLAEGEAAPDEEDDETPLEQRTVYVPFRAKKDPRDLRVLDPACGSGHFLLYSFDLLLVIYEEAWADPDSPASEATGRRLAEDYPSLADLRRALPGLLLRHNLHGVDIDPRAAQIAALALWMRAQRAWNDLGFKRAERPLVMRTNIVVAEPMPGEADLLDGLCADLEKPVADLVREVFEDMKLAGEAGTLLRIEETVRLGVEKLAKVGGLFAAEDARRWERLEAQVYNALRSYAESTGGAGYRRLLFAEDAARGFALIDACRRAYDVVLMNPPFGLAPSRARSYQRSRYARSKTDLFASFVERGSEVLEPGGALGAITSRTGFYSGSYQRWREEVVLGIVHPEVLADLGHGVMDAAMVEAAAYCLRKGAARATTAVFIDVLREHSKAERLREAAPSETSPRARHRYDLPVSEIRLIPGSPFAYWVSREVRRVFMRLPTFEEGKQTAKRGPSTSDDWRYVRCAWEVPTVRDHGLGRWLPFAKGGAFARFYSDLHLVVDFEPRRNTFLGFLGRPGREIERLESSGFFFRPGLTWTLRTSRGLSMRALPEGCVFSTVGSAAFATNDERQHLLALLSLVNSGAFAALIEVQLAAADAAARTYQAGVIQRTPLPDLLPGDELQLAALAAQAWSIQRTLDVARETSHAFAFPALLQTHGASLAERAERWGEHVAALEGKLADLQREIDALCFALYGINDADRHSMTVGIAAVDAADAGSDDRDGDEDDDGELEDNAEIRAASLTSWSVGVAFGRFDVRLATGDRALPQEPDPFAPLPACSPGMLTGDDGMSLAAPPDGYPVAFPTDGILVDDPGAPKDVIGAVRMVFGVVFGDDADARLAEARDLIDPRSPDLRTWLRSAFFAEHVKRYSKSRRKAPIHWQLGTPSGSYSVWLYIHRTGPDTLHAVLRDHVAPKLRFEENRLAALEVEAGDAPSTSQRKELASQEAFVDELRAFRDELDRVAPLWNPDLDDGVMINASFLYRLFLHTKPWAKECEKHWEKLKAGEYDWSHLAMRLWPERVVPKCADDRSLAIAHDLEDLLWVAEDGRWRQRATLDEEAERLASEAPTAVRRLVSKVRAWAEANGGFVWHAWSRGEHDAAPLALDLFPARVAHRIQRDQALAVAHGREVAWKPGLVDDAQPPPEETGTAGEVVRALAEAHACTPAGIGLFEALDAGALDHTTLSFWDNPARVIAACRKDRELADVHGVEGWFWVEEAGWRPRRDPDEEVAAVVRDRTSAAIREALREVSAAPPPAKATRSSRPARAPKAPRTRATKAQTHQLPLDLGASRAAAPRAALDALRAALHEFPGGAGKSDLLAASGLDEARWMPAITELVEAGEVERTGQKRGTRYRLAGRS